MSEPRNPFESRFGPTPSAETAATAVSSPHSKTVEPMRIGQLLDRALRFTPGLFQKFIVLFVIQAICVAISQVPEYQVNVAVRGVGTLIQIVLGLYLMVAMPLLAAKHWRGERASISAIRKDISIILILKTLWLVGRIAIVTGVLAIFFLIPGIIYFVNRILAVYILLMERTSVSDAMKKSKKLMLAEKWYHNGSPWMRVSGLMFLIMVVSAFASVPTIGATVLVTQGADMMLGLLLAAFFIGSFVQLFVQTFGALAYVGFYCDLLARYEATDILSGIETFSSK